MAPDLESSLIEGLTEDSMINRSSRRAMLGAIAALALSVGLLATTDLSQAAGSTATCPSVSASTGAVNPSPTPGIDWSNCDLDNADLSFADLTSADLVDAQLDKADLANADLTKADLYGALLTGADLSGADLSKTGLEAVSSGGITGEPTSIPTNWLLLGGYLIGPEAVLTNASLGGLDLSSAVLWGVSSGGVTGQPSALPADWSLAAGYLVGPEADLEKADLHGVNLAGDDLAGADINYANLTSADLAADNLSASLIQDATLADSDLAGADLEGSLLGHTTFGGASLADANLTDANAEYDNMSGADLGGANFTGAYLEGTSSGHVGGVPTLPADWVITGGYLLGPSANLAGADLDHLDVSGDDLEFADLADARVAGTNFSGTDLSYVASSGVRGTPSELPRHWRLVGGYLLGPYTDAGSVNLVDADLAGVDLADGLLRDANFSRSNLRSSNLEFSDMEFTNLEGANLSKADLLGALLEGADFEDVVWSDTTCPDGSNSDSHHDTCAGYLTPPDVFGHPVIAAGRKGRHGWYISVVTVDWNWTGSSGAAAACPTASLEQRSGRSVLLAASCRGSAGLIGNSFIWLRIDRTRPRVAVTGVRNGYRYTLGHVPAAGCRTTESISGVAVQAKLKVTHEGRPGTFTATCSGAISVAGIKQEAVVRVRYKVVR
jgi:uncharacterized protein YjbI with pentapeptide repeats